VPPELGNGETIDKRDVMREPGTGLWRLTNRNGGSYPGAVVWITNDKRGYTIPNMETTHIRNCIANILLGNIKGRGSYMPLLTAELEKRDNL
jgi:hypothetical protein